IKRYAIMFTHSAFDILLSLRANTNHFQNFLSRLFWQIQGHRDQTNPQLWLHVFAFHITPAHNRGAQWRGAVFAASTAAPMLWNFIK
ncbi:MAG: hypothetical protein KAU60_00995, partial [Desulfobacterales bacterium]|nr:hypothetical protein [Desulfobacterales bacterium]